MKDDDKTREQLLDELIQMRRCMAELQEAEDERKQGNCLMQLQRDLALALGAASSPAEALKRLLEASLQIEGIDSGAVYKVDPARGDFQLVSHAGLPPSFSDRISAYSSESPQTRVVIPGEPTYWPEAGGMLDNRSLLEEEGLTSLAVIPVKSAGQVVAVLDLVARTQNEVPESTRHALETIAASVGGILSRVNAEEALRNSQDRLTLALRASRAGTWDHDIAADKATWDEPLHAIFGLAPGSFSGRMEDFLGMVHPDDRERVRGELTSAIDGFADYSITYRVIWPDSGVHFIADRGKVYPDATGRAGRAVGVRWDITEQRSTDEALRESEARLSLATNAAGAGLWVAEPETGHVWVTPKTRELFHFAPDEALDYESFFQIIHPEDREWVRRTMQQALQTGESLYIDHRIVLPDGSIRWVVSRGQRYLKAGAGPGRMMGVSLDISERKKMEETLKVERENLAEANAALRALLRQREEDRRELEESLLTNVKTLVLPFAEKLRNTRLTPEQVLLLEIIESHLKEITSPLLRTLSRRFAGLTPMEIQVANLIKEGRATKEIAAILVASEKTVLFHRNNLRRKLGLTQKKINLRSYLSSLP